jgi:hypothetical protein
MKITNEQIAAKISAALRANGHRLFECKSYDATRNAQQNLEGKTYFVSPDNLKFHKSRVLSSRAVADGLLFKVTTSDSLDYNHTKRGVRVHLFDVFGTHVWGVDLGQASKDRKGAEKVFDAAPDFDVAAHYKKALTERAARLSREVAELTEAASAI